MFTHSSTRIFASVFSTARSIFIAAKRETALIATIAIISVISATMLIAQDTSSLQQTTGRFTRVVAPIDGIDPSADHKVPSPGLLDQAYGAVFGTKSIGSSNLTTYVTATSTPTASDNNYTRINNALQAASDGDEIILSGIFDWSSAEPFAAASWAAGSDGVPGNDDDYSILIKADLDNVKVTAASLGSATIKGPGDIVGVNLEGVFQFYNAAAPLRPAGTNQGWEFSNLEILDFDCAFFWWYQAASTTAAFNGTKVLGNRIRIPQDTNATIDPGDVSANIGIHYSFGANQQFSNNEFIFTGDGISDAPNYSAQVGMQSNTSGGSVYEGLQITNNILRVVEAENETFPQVLVGLWENGHAHSSNITVSGNSFLNESLGNSPALNLQRAFRTTSHSSATTTVSFSNNRMSGANIGIQMLNVGAVTHPVNFIGNDISNNATGLVPFRDLATANTIANLQYNRIAGNNVAIENATWPGTITANNNWWGCNYGPATSGPGCGVAPNGNTGTVTAGAPLTLSASASPTSTLNGGTSTITGTITNVPDLTPISFAVLTPAYGSSAANGATTSGGSQFATFTAAATDTNPGTLAPNTYGKASNTVTVDGQTMGAVVSIEPKVISINRKTPAVQQTNLTTLVYEVTFSAPVSNIDDTDFIVTQLDPPATGSITLVTCPSPFNKCDVTVSATGGSGQLRLDLADDDTITRRLASPLIHLGGNGAGNGDFNSGQDYIIDLSPPTVTSVTKLNPDPTAATSLQFSVAFSEPVTGVDSTDFSVTGTSGGTVSSVTGTGPYTVTVSGISAPSLSGTLGLNVLNNGSIFDTAAPTPNVLSGGTFFGPLYTVDQTPPTGTITQSIGQADPTAGMTVSFTVVFTDALAISGFNASDVTVATGSGTAFDNNTPMVTVSAPTISAPTTTYTVSVSNMDQPGQVTASIGDGTVTGVVDAVGNLGADVSENDNTVYYTFGLTTLIVDQDGYASDANFPASCADATPTAYTTIQSAINAASTGNTIKVCPALYNEVINVNKTLTLIGADKDTTIVSGPVGSSQQMTVFLNANNIDISNLKITRDGNAFATWGSGTCGGPSDLQCAGISIAQTTSGQKIHDNYITGTRTGIDINNSGGHTIRNNKIDFNRTGIIFWNTNERITVVENEITNNWTAGILFQGIGTPSFKDSEVINNNISGNWYAQVTDRDTNVNLKNFQGNWFGRPPTTTTGVSGEPGYSGIIPNVYPGGTYTTPAPFSAPITADIAGIGSGNVRFNLPLTSGADTNIETESGRGAFGFQGAPIVVSTETQGVDLEPLTQTNWWFFSEGLNGTGELELGPGATPLGTGSARLSVDATGRRSLGTYNYGGVRLDRITSLKYSSWQQSSNAAVAPALAFDYKSELPGAGAYEGRLTFEPYLNGTVQQGTWQNWDARAGVWWASGGANRPLNATGKCPQSTPCTWAQLLGHAPDLKIRHVADGGKLLFRAGGPVTTNFTGYVDNFEIGISTGETVFDFESDGIVAPTVVSSVRSSTPNPSSASSVDFTVTFSEPVTGLDTEDFTLFTSGVTGASVTSVTPVVLTYTPPLPALPSNYPSQTAFVVTVNTGSGSGTIRLDTVTSGLIEDLAGNDLTTGFTTGEIYTMDRDAVTVTVDHVGQADPTSVAPIKFRAVFSEAVTGFGVEPTDVVVSGSAGACGQTRYFALLKHDNVWNSILIESKYL